MASNKIKMNIIFIVNWLKRRGAEQQLFDFIKGLSPYVNASIFKFSNTDDELEDLIELDIVNIHSNRFPGTFNVLRFKSLYDCLSKEKYDAVVTLGLGTALFIGRICAILSGVKIVYSILNTVENFQKLPNLPGDYFDLFNKLVNKLIAISPGNRIYRFLPNSNSLSDRISSILTGFYPVQTLYNGIPREDIQKMSEYKPGREIALLESRIKGSPTVIQVGALDSNKNQKFSLECIREIKEQIPDIQFLIVGEGIKKSELIKWTIVNDMSNQVIFTGKVDRMECLYLMSKANLLLLTSGSESFPNVIVEAQALSLPIVSFDVGAVSEIIINGITGYLIRKGDQKGFKEAVVKILNDRSFAKQMGKLGQQRIIDNFSMDRKIERFLRMIENDLEEITDKTL